MAGTPKPQTPQPELAPGIPFTQAPAYQAPEASLPEILSSLAGLGLNVAGAITGAGAAGNQSLAAARDMRDSAENRASKDYQAGRQQFDQDSDQEVSKQLYERGLELPANERPSFIAMLKAGQWEKAQQFLGHNEVRQRMGKDDFERIRVETDKRIADLRAQGQDPTPENEFIENYFSAPERTEDLENQTPEGRQRLALKTMQAWNKFHSKYVGGQQMTLAKAKGVVETAMERYNNKAGGFLGFGKSSPEQIFKGYKAEATAADPDGVAAAQTAAAKIQQLRALRGKAAAGSAKAKEELKAVLMGGGEEPQVPGPAIPGKTQRGSEDFVMMQDPKTGRVAPVLKEKVSIAKERGLKEFKGRQ